MKRDAFSEAMSNIRAEYIDEAATFKKKNTFKWQNVAAIAAGICIFVGAGIFSLPKLTEHLSTDSLNSGIVAELATTSEENKTEVVYTVAGRDSENEGYVKYVNNTDGEVYGSSEGTVLEQSKENLASDFSDMIKAAPSPEPNYTLIPAYCFCDEDQSNTDKPFYWNAVEYIYGNHFIAAGVGDFLPVGVYVSDDGFSCYVINKKSDGTSTKTTYKILGAGAEDYEIVSVGAYPN